MRFVLAALAVATGILLAPIPVMAAEEPPLKGVFKDNFNPLNPPVPAPQTAFTDVKGHTVTLGDFLGKVVVLNFWATWCAPCVREMPTLDNLQAQLGGPEMAVVAVSEDRGGATVVQPFMKRYGLDHLEVYLDRKGSLRREFGATGLPTTLVIDSSGQVVGGLQGPAEWDSEEALELIRFYLSRAQKSVQPLKTSG